MSPPHKLPVIACLLPLLVRSLPIDNGVVVVHPLASLPYPKECNSMLGLGGPDPNNPTLRVCMDCAMYATFAGRPWVSCEEDIITLRARTEKPFVGRVFVKSMSKNEGCVQTYDQPLDVNIDLQISVGACQMRRQRSVEPPGMQQSIVVIVSFHPVFLTKVDMAYNIRCFYVSQPLTLSQVIDVSVLTPTDLYSEVLLTPKCDYTIRLDSKDGPLARYAVVGQPLFHVWRCDATPNDGILVRNCVVKDNSDYAYRALDHLGCPADEHIMGHLTYSTELNEAFVEVHAFKFADEPNLFFQCEIAMCTKNFAVADQRTNGQKPCTGLSPPNCEPAYGNEIQPPVGPHMPSAIPPLCEDCPEFTSQEEQPVIEFSQDEVQRKSHRHRSSSSHDSVGKSQLIRPPRTSRRSNRKMSSVERMTRATTEDFGFTVDVVPQNDYLPILDMVESNNPLVTTVTESGQLFDDRPPCQVGWEQRALVVISSSMAITMTLLSGLLASWICHYSIWRSKQAKRQWRSDFTTYS